MKRHIAGFTLVELMVAITIAAVLIAIAAPNFSGVLKTNRVQSQLRDLIGDINYARSEAVSRGRYVTICPSNNNFASCSGSWSDGWFIFVESSKIADVGTYESGSESGSVLRKHASLGGNKLTVVDGGIPVVAQDHITFFNSGSTSQVNGMTLSLCDIGKDVKYARAVLKVGAGQFLFSKQGANGVFLDVKGNELACP